MELLHVVGTILGIVSTVTAATTRPGSGGSSSIGLDSFDAPQLAVAKLVVYTLLLFATIVQSSIVAPALSRRGSRIPAVGMAIALSVVAIAYTLGIADIVNMYADDGTALKFLFDIIRLKVATIVFLDLKDLAMFTAVGMVLRHRYLSGKPSSPTLIRFTGAAFVLFVAMSVFLGAYTRIYEATIRAHHHLEFSSAETTSHINTSNDLFYVFVALQILAVLFLSISTFLLNSCARNDPVITLALFVIVPLLLLFGAARTIFVILEARLPRSDSYMVEGLTLELSSAVVLGLLHLAIFSVLLFLLSRPRLWSVQPVADTPLPAEEV